MGYQQGGFCQMISSSQNMEIPKSFVSHEAAAGGSLGERWFLRDIHCHIWSVEVATEGTRYLLHRGWSDFYTHNLLEQGDILIFERRNHNLFDFKIFGPNGCEKGQGRPRPMEEEELEGKNEENVVADVDDEEEEDDDKEEDEDVDYNEEEEDISRPKTTPAFGAGPRKRQYKQHQRDCYGSEIFKSGLATRPENPYFVSRSRTLARVNELPIPKDVIEDYHLEFPEKLIFVDQQGRKWKAKMKQWKDGRLWCTGGWKRLCHVNNIGPNDTCICEFVRPEEDVMWIRVRRVAT